MHVLPSTQFGAPFLASTAPANGAIGALFASTLRHPVSSAFLAVSLCFTARFISLFVAEWRYFQIESLQKIDLHFEKVASQCLGHHPLFQTLEHVQLCL